jgi:hypothetical protein
MERPVFQKALRPLAGMGLGVILTRQGKKSSHANTGAGSFNDGVAKVLKGGKWIVIDKNEKKVEE